MAKDENYNKLICSVRWRRLRRAVLTRHPFCQRCERQGKITGATEVHHVIPVEEGVSFAEKERLAYDPTNLMALCHDCHIEIHTRELGRGTREHRIERNKKHLQNFKEKFFMTGG